MIVKCGDYSFDVSVCSSLFSNFLGLMFRKLSNDGLFFIFSFEMPISLHMFFVFYVIDIVYINKNLSVVKVLKKVKPFTPHISAVNCKYILELKDCKDIKVGDKLATII